jgi:Protein of unknown function (DUF3592)
MSAQPILGFFIVCGGFLWCGMKAVQVWIRLNRAACWVTVPGVILESRLTWDSLRKVTNYRVRYSFVAGERMESTTARLCGHDFVRSSKQSEFVARYRVGQPVDVYHDPQNPALNCLDRTDRTGLYVYAFVSLFCLFLAWFFVWLWTVHGLGRT